MMFAFSMMWRHSDLVKSVTVCRFLLVVVVGVVTLVFVGGGVAITGDDVEEGVVM